MNDNGEASNVSWGAHVGRDIVVDVGGCEWVGSDRNLAMFTA